MHKQTHIRCHNAAQGTKSVLRQNFFGLTQELPAHLRELLPLPEKRLDGSLLVWGFAARGECIYTYPEGDTETRLYRPGSVVFDPSVLESFRGVPVTNNHPPEEDGYMVTPENWREQAHGAVLEPGRAWPEHGVVGVPMTLQSQDIIAAYHAGKVALSTGELCTERLTSGQVDGQPYDRVLVEVAMNHLALVHAGQAGPLARLRVHQVPYTLQSPTPQGAEDGAGDSSMKYIKILIFGHEYWVPENEQEAARARIERQITTRVNEHVAAREQELAAEHTATCERLEARADEAEAQVATLTANPGVTEEEVETRVNEAVNSRVADEVTTRVNEVTRVLPLFDGKTTITRANEAGVKTEVSLYTLSKEDLLREAILTRRPNAKLDGKSLGYLEGRIEALFEHKSTSDKAAGGLADASTTARANARGDEAGDAQTQRDKAREDAAKHLERRTA